GAPHHRGLREPGSVGAARKLGRVPPPRNTRVSSTRSRPHHTIGARRSRRTRPDTVRPVSRAGTSIRHPRLRRARRSGTALGAPAHRTPVPRRYTELARAPPHRDSGRCPTRTRISHPRLRRALVGAGPLSRTRGPRPRRPNASTGRRRRVPSGEDRRALGPPSARPSLAARGRRSRVLACKRLSGRNAPPTLIPGGSSHRVWVLSPPRVT